MEKDHPKLSKSPALAGVHVALATPFKSDGSVCFASLEKILERQIQAGVDGLVPMGTTGEVPTLTTEERVQILRLCVDIGRRYGKKVIAGCGSNNTQAVITLMRQAQEMGCDAALVITPYYNKPTQEGLVQHFLTVAQATTLPVLLYHSQGRSGVSLSMSTFGKLFEHPRIVGVKEASGNHSTWLALGEAFADKKTLLSGDDDMMASFCGMGAQGIISASCNVAPKAFVRLWAAVQAGNWPAAFDIQLRILPLVRALFAETNPMAIKYALSRMGLCENTLRLPLVPVSSATQAMVDTALESMRSADFL